MTKSMTRIGALALAAATLGTPAFAQRRDRGARDQRQSGERAQPRQREEQPRQREDRRDARQGQDRRDDRRADRRDDRRDDRRSVIVPRSSRPSYVVPSRPTYGYRSYAYRAPYGYRPFGSLGYRPGWNLGLYFGRPYSAYGYPAYGYGSAPYGYYSVVPGRAYGAVRIVDAPRDAQVFVDGYYAGVVDDYDGVFQHLNLEPGVHRIAIEAPGWPPVEFDVRVVPGETITYRARP